MTWVALYTGMGEPNSHCRHQKPGGIIDIIFQLEEKRQQGWSSLFTAKNESEKRWKALEDPIPLKASYRIIFVSHSLQTHVSFPSIIEEVCSKTSTPNGWAELRRTQNYSLTSCTLFWGKILHTPCCRFLPAYFFFFSFLYEIWPDYQTFSCSNSLSLCPCFRLISLKSLSKIFLRLKVVLKCSNCL